MSPSPWKSIWLKPKEAFEQLKQTKPRYMWWFFAVVVGLTSVLSSFGRGSLTALSEWQTLVYIILAVVCSPLLVWALFHLGGYILWKVSGWFKGSCSLREAKTVFVWSQAPTLINFLFLLLITIFAKVGGINLLNANSVATLFNQHSGLGLLAMIVSIITFIWMLYIYLSGIQYINNFKAGKAIGTWIVTSFIYTVVSGIAASVLMFIIAFFVALIS